MDVKKLILLVGALVIAGVSAFFVRNLVSTGGTQQVQAAIVTPDGPQVLVATRALPLGTILNEKDFAFQPWPKDHVENVYFLEKETDLASLNGRVVRYPIPAGQPVTKGAIVGPGERGFLAAALVPGMRAVTVSISDTSGVAGFIFPGDRVDLILTHGVSYTGASEVGTPADQLKVAETILKNVRVLAVDQRLPGGPNAAPAVGRTVTFEVPPKYVEKIAVAQTLGKISLSLRSLSENTAELERAIASGEVEIGDDQDAAADRRLEYALANKPSDNNPTYTTGGEVSRFASNLSPRASRSGGSGETVRVFRGGSTTEVPVGAN
jgi:pilus assembly protein CpaB